MGVNLTGILAGLLAGAFWGFSFLVPKILSDVSPSQIALGRFEWFGLLSLITLLARKGFRKDAPVFKYWKQALILAISGYSLYYYLLVSAIQLTGIPISSLIVGLLPVTIALMSGDQVHRPKLFATSVAVIAVGILVLNRAAFEGEVFTHFPHAGIGILFSVLCLLLWSYFALVNARFVKRHADLDGLEWSSVLGIYTALSMLVIDFFGAHALTLNTLGQTRAPLTNLNFLGLTALLGIFPTFIATRLWNFASKTLPTGLVAQLIVSETIFALIYGFFYDGKFPTLSEWGAMVLVISGVLLAVRAYHPES